MNISVDILQWNISPVFFGIFLLRFQELWRIFITTFIVNGETFNIAKKTSVLCCECSWTHWYLQCYEINGKLESNKMHIWHLTIEKIFDQYLLLCFVKISMYKSTKYVLCINNLLNVPKSVGLRKLKKNSFSYQEIAKVIWLDYK